MQQQTLKKKKKKNPHIIDLKMFVILVKFSVFQSVS